MDYEAEYEGCGGIFYVKSFSIFHRFQVVSSKSSNTSSIRLLTEKPLHTENTVSYKQDTNIQPKQPKCIPLSAYPVEFHELFGYFRSICINLPKRIKSALTDLMHLDSFDCSTQIIWTVLQQSPFTMP